tara:strand:+ start:5003 stop:7105 length:2103 start_codon:yes stop_codon:yes gene_type:complete
MANRLANQTSPYLLQHSENPVDWYPWGEESLEASKLQNKPILLSIGYSSCHWCHVMEKESFEDVETAELMNKYFINIKVDREERPDIDSIYMQAVLAQNGHGGWPMTVFLTPEKKPFFSGTYFPPEPRHGMPSFKQVLEAMSNAYYNKYDEIAPLADKLTTHISFESDNVELNSIDSQNIVDSSLLQLNKQYDKNYGGFGSAPKFPQPTILNYLLEIFYSTKNHDCLDMVIQTLNGMACGGIYDQIGGGFHRYSTDEFWLVPHFEKMLYDNALISSVYIDAYKITKNTQYLRIVKETLDYIILEMTGNSYEFYSSQDADSEGIEGKYFTWELDEIEKILGKDNSKIFCEYYGVQKNGNFEGTNILHIRHDHSLLSAKLNIQPESLSKIIEECRRLLFNKRNNRVKPSTDTKIITSWNAMMAKSFAKASIFLGTRYLDIAIKNTEYILTNLIKDNHLIHTNNYSNSYGYLEDYVYLLDTLITLHSITLEYIWIEKAENLSALMIELFWDNESSRFYDTSNIQKDLIFRPRDSHDGVIPSAHSMSSVVLNKLSLLLNNAYYKTISELNITSVIDLIDKASLSFTNWLSYINATQQKPNELIISYPKLSKRSTQILSLASDINQFFNPYLLISGVNQFELPNLQENPLYKGKTIVDHSITGYYCSNFICDEPLTELGKLIDKISKPYDKISNEWIYIKESFNE